MFLKKPTARRALSELGISDSKANLKMAEALFTITAEQFMKKWNFDPIRCCPLPPGRYQWTPARAVARKHLREQDVWDTSPSGDLEHDDPSALFLEGADYVSRLAGDGRPAARYLEEDLEDGRCCDLQEEEVCATGRPTLHLALTPRKTHKTSHSLTPRTKQCKITDYGRQRKRLHSCSKCEDSEPDVTTPRKKLALSPSTPSK